MASSSPSVSLNTIVVGGGVCGLASAIALRSWSFGKERHSETFESGAGIVLSQNGVRVLKQWGLEPSFDDVGMLKYQRGEIRNGKTTELISKQYDASEHNDTDFTRMTTRRDLCSVLKKEALAKGGVSIQYNSPVVDYSLEKPSVTLADGTQIHADLVVACDGIHSRAMKHVCGYENPATPTGYSTFRFMVPTARLASSEPFQRKNKEASGHAWFNIDYEGKMLVWSPTRKGELQSFDGTQAIEDAAALEICFSHISDSAEIPSRLAMLQELRLRRTSCVQWASTIRHDHDREAQYKSVLERCRGYYDKDENQEHLDSTQAFLEWLWKYDMRAVAQAHLERQGVIPNKDLCSKTVINREDQ